MTLGGRNSCKYDLTFAVFYGILGTLQFAGVKVNVVTYVCLVISVGLLVDFLMHLLLR